MKPKLVFLARHGESVGNVDKRVYAKIPDYTLPLTAQGRKQAEQLGKTISQHIGQERIHFYISPWRRARKTFMGVVRALNRNQWSATEDPRLREQE